MKKKTEKHVKKAPREKLIESQLRRLGKVGGVKDSRFGVRDKNKSDQEKYLQRHIVERLRHLDDIQFEKDEEDPMIKVAFGEQSITKLKNLRMDEQSDVGIHAHVTEEFFSKGSHSQKFRDSLAEKIAISKLEKLKRVEENEEQRNRLKTADIDWSQKIRFLLSGVSIKSKKPTSTEVIKNRANFQRLLETMGSDKRVAPVGAPVADPNIKEKKILRLQTILSESSARNTDDSIGEKLVSKSVDRRKNVALILLLELMSPDSASDSGCHALVLPENGLCADDTAISHLDIRLTDPSIKLTREQLPLIKLSCVNCLLELCSRAHTLYSRLLPSTVCIHLFAPMRSVLERLSQCKWHTQLSQRVNSLLETMDSIARTKTPEFLTANIRLTLLSSDQPEDSRTLKKMGLIPQLEPRFEEKLDARRPKNTDPRRSIQRKLAREKRGAMREMRRDSQFLAAHQLKVTKQNLTATLMVLLLDFANFGDRLQAWF
ncbi:unnamed protein product [Echinostoma caproni]|uniref:Nucleolar protein 14 n=1 Tax=Echinostoma caproni TaxID=27848 RepID=A0A183ASC8_9TREM|nr:unnamed protein product [Echinostoma caproni]